MSEGDIRLRQLTRDISIQPQSSILEHCLTSEVMTSNHLGVCPTKPDAVPLQELILRSFGKMPNLASSYNTMIQQMKVLLSGTEQT